VSDDKELAEMKRQYRYATREDHMLVDGVLHLRCRQCGIRPIPKYWSFAALCDPCLDERLEEMRAAAASGQ
jgi:hypothetical protein